MCKTRRVLRLILQSSHAAQLYCRWQQQQRDARLCVISENECSFFYVGRIVVGSTVNRHVYASNLLSGCSTCKCVAVSRLLPGPSSLLTHLPVDIFRSRQFGPPQRQSPANQISTVYASQRVIVVPSKSHVGRKVRAQEEERRRAAMDCGRADQSETDR